MSNRRRLVSRISFDDSCFDHVQVYKETPLTPPRKSKRKRRKHVNNENTDSESENESDETEMNCENVENESSSDESDEVNYYVPNRSNSHTPLPKEESTPNIHLQNEEESTPNIHLQKEEESTPNIHLQKEEESTPNIHLQKEEESTPNCTKSDIIQLTKVHSFHFIESDEEEEKEGKGTSPDSSSSSSTTTATTSSTGRTSGSSSESNGESNSNSNSNNDDHHDNKESTVAHNDSIMTRRTGNLPPTVVPTLSVASSSCTEKSNSPMKTNNSSNTLDTTNTTCVRTSGDIDPDRINKFSCQDNGSNEDDDLDGSNNGAKSSNCNKRVDSLSPLPVLRKRTPPRPRNTDPHTNTDSITASTSTTETASSPVPGRISPTSATLDQLLQLTANKKRLIRQGSQDDSSLPRNSRMMKNSRIVKNSLTSQTSVRGIRAGPDVIDTTSSSTSPITANTTTNSKIINTNTNFIQTSPASNRKKMIRKPSQDDSCVIVKCEKSKLNKVFHLPNPINSIINSFPSFDIFKSNIKKTKKRQCFQQYMIDSERLYTLLDHLSWSFSFHPEKRKAFTKKLLLDKEGIYTPETIQRVFEKHFNLRIGFYEAKQLMQYANLYKEHHHEDTSVSLHNESEDGTNLFFDMSANDSDHEGDGSNSKVKDNAENVDHSSSNTINKALGNDTSDGYDDEHHNNHDNDTVGTYYTSKDLPFSLLLPNHKTKQKWCDAIDKLAIRQLKEATNLGAANMTKISTAKRKKSNGNENHNHNKTRIFPTNSTCNANKETGECTDAPYQRITKLELKEFRAKIMKARPRGRRGSAPSVDVAVLRSTTSTDTGNKDATATDTDGASASATTTTDVVGFNQDLPPDNGISKSPTKTHREREEVSEAGKDKPPTTLTTTLIDKAISLADAITEKTKAVLGDGSSSRSSNSSRSSGSSKSAKHKSKTKSHSSKERGSKSLSEWGHRRFSLTDNDTSKKRHTGKNTVTESKKPNNLYTSFNGRVYDLNASIGDGGDDEDNYSDDGGEIDERKWKK